VGHEVFYEAEGTRFVLLRDRLVVQYRAGQLTHAAIDAAVDVLDNTLMTREDTVGLMAIVDGSATLTSVEIQARQKMALRRLVDEADGWVCTVTLGDGVEAMSMAAVGYVLLLGHARVRHFQDVETAAVWLASKLTDVTPVEIVRACETAQALADAAP